MGCFPPPAIDPSGGPALSEHTGTRPSRGLGGTSPTIVVVDADRTARADSVEVLQVAGYRVNDVGSFEAARRVLEAMTPDLLIADIRLGVFNGLQLVWRRHVKYPQGASIVTNTYADPVLEQQARAFNAPYLVKPISGELLLRVVARALGVFVRTNFSTSARTPPCQVAGSRSRSRQG